MPTHHINPVEGNWYHSKSFPETESFVVVDHDTSDIEIQYSDGEIDNIGYDRWNELNPEEVAEDEDETAAYGLAHDDDIIKLLREIEEHGDLEEHLHNIDRDESDWD